MTSQRDLLAPLTIATIGPYSDPGGVVTIAGRVARALRTPTRTPLQHWDHNIDPDTASHALHQWARRHLDIDIDAICPAPSHDNSTGPGHTAALAVAAALDVPIVDLCARARPIPSALTTRRSHWRTHLATLTTRTGRRPLRVAIVDNAITTGHTALATASVLTLAGHCPVAVIAAAGPRNLYSEALDSTSAVRRDNHHVLW